jgi:hypothetical protein
MLDKEAKGEVVVAPVALDVAIEALKIVLAHTQHQPAPSPYAASVLKEAALYLGGQIVATLRSSSSQQSVAQVQPMKRIMRLLVQHKATSWASSIFAP